jgi:hypothetical protein
MSYPKSIQGNMIHEGPKLSKGPRRYHRVISNTPIIPGRWRGVANPEAFEKAIYSTMDMAQNVLTPNGTITTNVGRGPAFYGQNELKRWQALNVDRTNGLEEVPETAFRVWYGTWRDLNNNDVLVHGRPENHHFKTFRRVGSTDTINNYTLPDSVPQIPINNVTKSPGLYPVDAHPSPDEGEQWLLDKGYDYRLKANNPNFEKFKAMLVEFDHNPGVYIQIPLPQEVPLGFWGLSTKIINHLHEGRGTRHAMGRVEKYANHDIWLYYWMMKVFSNPGEDIVIPFAADGELTLAALMNGSVPTTIELNTNRHEINRDIIQEWQRSFYG